MRRGPRWSQKGGRPLAHAARASVAKKRRWPPRQCGRGLSGPKTHEVPSPIWRGLGGPKRVQVPWPMRRGCQWSQNGGGPLAHAAEASVAPRRTRPPRP